MYFTTAI